MNGNRWLDLKASLPQAISFDVGGTLIVPFPSVGEVYARVANRVGMGEFAAAPLDQSFRAAFRERLLIRYSPNEWREVVRRTFSPFTDRSGDPQLFDALWQEFMQPAAWQIFDDVVPVLKRLRQNGIRLAITSNWDLRLRPTLEGLGLAGFFEVILASAEVGQPKPEITVFQETARRLGLSPETILHVGDSQREDVEGPRAAGFQALLLNRTGRLSQGVLKDLTPLANLFTDLA